MPVCSGKSSAAALADASGRTR